MASLDLQIAFDHDDEMRALYQALIRAVAAERSEVNRLRSLRGTGYLALSETQSGTALSEQGRAEVRVMTLSALVDGLRERMRRDKVEPW
jgi:hypothetical protein